MTPPFCLIEWAESNEVSDSLSGPYTSSTAFHLCQTAEQGWSKSGTVKSFYWKSSMSQYHVPVAFLRVTQIDKLNAIMFYAAFESGNPAIIADPCSPGCLQCAYC